MHKKKLLVASCAWIVVCFITLISFSAAWVRRDWNPMVYEERIEIQTGGSLAIRLDDTGNAFNTIRLNEIVGVENFRLKQVSNLTGRSEDFFGLKVEDNMQNATLTHLTPTGGEDYTTLAKNNGYIEVRFLLVGKSQADSFNQYIYLSEDSNLSILSELEHLKDDDPTEYAKQLAMINAIRISITVHTSTNASEEKHYCLRKTKAGDPVSELSYPIADHLAIRNSKNEDGSYFADGKSLFSSGTTVDSELTATTDAFKDFAYYQAAYKKDPDTGTETLDTSRCFFMMQPTESRWVTLRVWLEGCDPGCTNDIAGMLFNLSIRFDSVNRPADTATTPTEPAE